MDALQSAQRHYATLIERARAQMAASEPDWLREQRAAAAARFDALGLPTRKHEAWRYTRLDPLLDTHFESTSRIPQALPGGLRSRVDSDTPVAARAVLVDGRWVEATDAPREPGLQICSLADLIEHDPEWLRQYLGRVLRDRWDSFSALNTVLAGDGVVVHVGAGQRIEQPVELLFAGTRTQTALVSSPRTLVVLEAGAQLTLVEQYAGEADAVYFHNGVCELILGDGAELAHFRIQREAPQATHLGAIHTEQGASSRLRSACVALGASWSRTEYHVGFRGADADCTLSGLYLTGERQLTDFHLNVRHGTPNCASRAHFRGIVAGRGRAVFDGRIEVAHEAQKTDAHLFNANLLLARDAEVDTKPQLEIYADDVQCSHGTTVGELDPLQLFYLRSRGIDTGAARRMLSLGFVREVLATWSVGNLRADLEAEIESRLDHSEAI